MKIFIQMLWALVAIGTLLGAIVFGMTLAKAENNISGYLSAICLILIPYALVKAFEGMLKED